MKKYIVISHSNGLFIRVVAQFDDFDRAADYASLSMMGNPNSQFEVYAQK